MSRAIGGTATVVVTKFAGTPKQVIETHTVDATKPSTVKVTLAGGSRTALATVPMELSEARMATTAKPMATGTVGVSGGVGSATANLMATSMQSKSTAISTVANEAEQTLTNGTNGGPTLRAAGKVTADRQGVQISVNPVFSGPATEIAVPKVAMLPGAGE